MRWWAGCGIAFASILYCELLADYITLMQCSWPDVPNKKALDNEKELRALILADTHLLGPLRGHWLDKLYREWHMHRAFQAALFLLRPDVVFILGDIFDEGDLVDQAQFQEYVQRFRRHFATAAVGGVPIVSAVGNHDVGFHYKMHPFFLERFEHHFNNTGVRLYTFNEVHFVFINSMAMENDGCYLCQAAEQELSEIAADLQCLKGVKNCGNDKSKLLLKHKSYSRPIVMQHFPTYRSSDKVCREHDSPIVEMYRENWEVLSKKSTDLLGKLLNPRVAFGGHSHHYCRYINRWGVEEYTVASFSWRNKINPSFLLATFTPSKHAVKKCNMLQQPTVYNIYLATIVVCIALSLWYMYQKMFHAKLNNEIRKQS